jgi:hypothetical protein
MRRRPTVLVADQPSDAADDGQVPPSFDAHGHWT